MPRAHRVHDIECALWAQAKQAVPKIPKAGAPLFKENFKALQPQKRVKISRAMGDDGMHRLKAQQGKWHGMGT
jgi:hypothetical protein